MTQENLCTGFGAKKGYSQIKPVKALKARVKCQLFLSAQSEIESCKMCLSESQILFSKRAGIVGTNAFSAFNALG